MTNIIVSSSPRIVEQLRFGVGLGVLPNNLGKKILDIELESASILDVDLVFGTIRASLPNPTLDLEKYTITRSSLIDKLSTLLKNEVIK